MIGTAGWSIPKAVADGFPERGTHLERYAAVMSATEINSSFHRPHRRKSYERWAASTPAAFRFSVKVPKAISHTRKLVATDDLIEVFVEQIGGLGDRLGVVLLQLPPSLAFDFDIASAFLCMLREQIDVVGPHVAIAAEPRHASWFTEAANMCLVQQRTARVAADPILAPGGERPGGWTGLRYRRLHGSPRVYHSSYDEPFLAALAGAIAGDPTPDTTSWCIFDNTASGAALANALSLQGICQR